jgi:hypothetical protein
MEIDVLIKVGKTCIRVYYLYKDVMRLVWSRIFSGRQYWIASSYCISLLSHELME